MSKNVTLFQLVIDDGSFMNKSVALNTILVDTSDENVSSELRKVVRRYAEVYSHEYLESDLEQYFKLSVDEGKWSTTALYKEEYINLTDEDGMRIKVWFDRSVATIIGDLDKIKRK